MSRGSPLSVGIADSVLALVNEVTPGMTLKYNKHYIGLAKGSVADNFLIFFPRKEHVIASFRIPRSDELTEAINGSGLDSLAYDQRAGRYQIHVSKTDVDAYREFLLDLIRRASGVPAPVEE